MYEIHVVGTINNGKMPEFFKSCVQWKTYRKTKKMAIPKVLTSISGQMNTVRMVFVFNSLSDYEKEEVMIKQDKKYSKIASLMPFKENISYEIFSIHNK